MKNILLSRKFLIPVFVIGIIYLVVAVYLMNYKLVINTIAGDYPYLYKLNILIALLEGMWTAMTKKALTLLVFTSFLTGANLTLVVKRLRELKSIGHLHLLAGGGSLLGIIGSGCVICGLPVITLLGLGSSVAYLPFRGTELSYLAVGMLAFSFSALLKTSSQRLSCDIPDKKLVTNNRSYATCHPPA